MQQRSLGPFTVSAIGLGCMNFCHAYGVPVSEAQAQRVLLASLDAGVTHFDTATLYGFGQSELLLGKYLAPHRKRFTLASKCGMHAVIGPDGKKVRAIDGRPATLRQNCEDSLKRLNTEVIDLYYLHRWDKTVPIEESVGALGDLVKAGKIRAVGLSEVSAATLRKAHAEFPISAVQSEYSLWTRNPEIAVLQACAQLGVALVAFSPVARGFLTSAPPNRHCLMRQTFAKTCRVLPSMPTRPIASSCHRLQGWRKRPDAHRRNWLLDGCCTKRRISCPSPAPPAWRMRWKTPPRHKRY